MQQVKVWLFLPGWLEEFNNFIQTFTFHSNAPYS
ncbi:hypothetical protein EcE24377A_4375 [Escherichia coli O139:H28 str. E24377A]|uniref:Uncharacterized protein n=1 Tax=Escherichia coli O139:H28 (strain E24377A / ETEC) TaxID=331111 RepID=A7ZU58_ECO24|nr:hypothetical protein EcE24377A_4375 [Escherichia coli O139:H28 str. E24377A]